MKKLMTGLVLGLVFTLSACGSTGTAVTEAPKETKMYTHDLGETDVPMNPENVVVFDWATLDTMVELGVEETVIGVPQTGVPNYLNQFSDEKYTNVGSAKEADFETIAALNPELIIISGRQKDLYDQLAEIAPTLYLNLDYNDYMASVDYNVTTVGEIFGVEDAAEAALTAVHSEVDALVQQTAGMSETALVTLANEGKVSAYGNQSRFGLVYETFGLTNIDPTIEASTHGQTISFEYLLEKNPDYLYVVDRSAVVEGSQSAQALFDNEIMKQTKAAQNNRIVYLTPEYWYIASGGLEAVSQMIAEVANSLK
ncbi:MAG: siderophore ABC transporter substrate-binding protein [Culicoidibacterales bacterium]